ALVARVVVVVEHVERARHHAVGRDGDGVAAGVAHGDGRAHGGRAGAVIAGVDLTVGAAVVGGGVHVVAGLGRVHDAVAAHGRVQLDVEREGARGAGVVVVGDDEDGLRRGPRVRVREALGLAADAVVRVLHARVDDGGAVIGDHQHRVVGGGGRVRHLEDG